MTPQDFHEQNAIFGPPVDFDESQVSRIPAWQGTAQGGSCDGQPIIVVAWAPSEAELERIAAGCPIFLTMFGGLSPHMLSTDFHSATHPL